FQLFISHGVSHVRLPTGSPVTPFTRTAESFMSQRLCLIGFLLLIAIWSQSAFCTQTGGGARSVNVGSSSFPAPLPLAHGDMEEGNGSAPQSGGRHFISWIGHFHPALTVFPIAMVLSAALAELLLI